MSTTTLSPQTTVPTQARESRLSEMHSFCDAHPAIDAVVVYEATQTLVLRITDDYANDSFVRSVEADTLAKYRQVSRHRYDKGYIFEMVRK